MTLNDLLNMEIEGKRKEVSADTALLHLEHFPVKSQCIILLFLWNSLPELSGLKQQSSLTELEVRGLKWVSWAKISVSEGLGSLVEAPGRVVLLPFSAPRPAPHSFHLPAVAVASPVFLILHHCDIDPRAPSSIEALMIILLLRYPE